MMLEHSTQPTPPTAHSHSHSHSHSLLTIIPSPSPSDQKRKREEEMSTTTELVETNSPHSPSPSPSLSRFQLQPTTPDLNPYTDHNKIEKGACYRCGEQGHWASNCNNKSLSFSPNQNNHSPFSSQRIYCRCGHGRCDVKTSRSVKNNGRKYFTCPITRGARCCKTAYNFIKWCDEITESDFQPPRFKYPECQCKAGVCRMITEKKEFVCPLKQGQGSCGYRVSEDELRKNTRIDTTDIDLVNDLSKGIDLISTTKRMRVTDNSENPSPVAVSESPVVANSEHVGFPVFDDADDDDDDDAEGWEAIEELEASRSSHLSTPSSIQHRQSVFAIEELEASRSSHLPTPSSIQHRQSVFERDISAADPSLGISPSFDSIVEPEQGSTPNGDLAVNSVSKHDQFPTISPAESFKDVVSPTQRLRKVVLYTQRGLLSELENLGPHQHESMRQEAESTFEELDRLGIECKQFFDHIWDFINLASSEAEIDKSVENTPTLEEHNKFLEGEKVRLALIQDDCLKTEASFETFNQQRKLVSEEVSEIEAMLHKKQAELKSCELETMRIETQLGDLKRSMLEVDISLKDRVRQAEVAREKSAQRQTMQFAAKKALQKAKLELEN